MQAPRHNIIAGLPGSVESWTIDNLRRQLAVYAGIDDDDEKLRRHLFDFLEAVVPVAESAGVRICVHPDDPPFRLLGLPKAVSTANDYARLLDHVASPVNGMTFCSGSLGSRAITTWSGSLSALPTASISPTFAMLLIGGGFRRMAFSKTTIWTGMLIMVAVLGVLMAEQKRRRDAGRSDWQIPMRSDHAHELLNDVERKAPAGYPAIGRLKGLAELRGVMRAFADSPALKGSTG